MIRKSGFPFNSFVLRWFSSHNFFLSIDPKSACYSTSTGGHGMRKKIHRLKITNENKAEP